MYKNLFVYLVIFNEEVVVLLADVSDKKHQQEIIDSIYVNRNLFKELVKNLKDRDIQ